MYIKSCYSFVYFLIGLFTWITPGYVQAQISNNYFQSSIKRVNPDFSALQWWITGQHNDASTGLYYVYATAIYNEIPVPDWSLTTVFDANLELTYLDHSLPATFQDLTRNSFTQSISHLEAMKSVLGSNTGFADYFKSTENPFEWKTGPKDEIKGKIQLIYIVIEESILPYWEIHIEDPETRVWKTVLIDAQSGIIADEVSHLHQCSFDSGGNHLPATENPNNVENHGITLGGNQGTYRVFELPVESPLYGPRSLVSDVHDAVYSPFGWHDTDGVTGADQTTLNGNNTIVYYDRDGDYQGNGTTDGGSALSFDFPFDPDGSPKVNKNAAATNLWYVVNRTHDILGHLGFTEGAGNFQLNNYSAEGQDGDPIESYYQFGADNPGLSNPATINNANFMSPVDGFDGVLRMYVWDRSDRKLLTITAPAEIAGIYETAIALFGPQVGSDPISAPLDVVNDGVGVVSDGCQTIQNDVNGKIAIIDRGDCTFGEKVFNAQQAGAVAVIIADNRPGNIQNMQDSDFGPLVNIPTIRVTQSDGALLKAYLNDGLMIEIVRPDLPGPDTLDSAFDNGLVIHELGHGLSNRLTGGPARANCLRNFTYGDAREGEQMGEGWSDYLGIALTQSGSANMDRQRTVAAYLNKESAEGGGIRPYPYSPNMEINPVTYYDIYDASIPHGVGHVWASILWDLHWTLIDQYGFDADLISGNGGNKIAIQLMIDGLKLQPCDPGFVDGRDAILMADSLRYGGANQCMIWEVFARRGLGFEAEQGNDRYRRDGKESYDIPPACTGEVLLTKRSELLIERGEIYSIRFDISNHTGEDLTGVTLDDQVPENNTVLEDFLPSSAVNLGGIVRFDIGNLPQDTTVTITYLLEASEEVVSERLMLDDLESEPESRFETQSVQGSNAFFVDNAGGIGGSTAWRVEGSDETCMQVLSLLEDLNVPGEGIPVLRFSHRYDTEDGADGGLVEISTNDGGDWQDAGTLAFRWLYENRISVSTFQQVDQAAFTGESSGWRTTYLDLTPFMGQQVKLRFRFGCDFQNASEGWRIDNIELFNAIQYIGLATLTNDQGFNTAASNVEYGTLLEPEDVVSNKHVDTQPALGIYPNPATDQLNISGTFDDGEYALSVFNIQGQSVYYNANFQWQASSGEVDIAAWKQGVYIIHLRHDEGYAVGRFMKF